MPLHSKRHTWSGNQCKQAKWGDGRGKRHQLKAEVWTEPGWAGGIHPGILKNASLKICLMLEGYTVLELEN